MTEREKVIKGLECCIIARTCSECPYIDEYPEVCTSGECIAVLMKDALELLKAEKKTKVVFKQYDGYDGWIESECGNCGQYLDKAYSHCPKCNKELDWNGG